MKTFGEYLKEEEDQTVYHPDTGEPLFTFKNYKPQHLHLVREAGGTLVKRQRYNINGVEQADSRPSWASGYSQSHLDHLHYQFSWHPYQTDNHPHLRGEDHFGIGNPHKTGFALYTEASRREFNKKPEAIPPTTKFLENLARMHRVGHQEATGSSFSHGNGSVTPHYSWFHTQHATENDDGTTTSHRFLTFATSNDLHAQIHHDYDQRRVE